MNRRFARIHFVPAGLAALWVGAPVGADIVVQANGKIVVGRVMQEDQPDIRVFTGTAQGPREVSIPRTKITRLLRGDEETARVHSCNDPQLLSQWTAAYYFAGLEMSATRCLERALTLDASIGAKPMATPKPADGPAAQYATFWNRAILRHLAASAPKGDTRRLLQIARWARSAGKNDVANNYLRRAWNTNPNDESIKRLASEWDAALESWVQLDLTPALDGSLFSREIVDENVHVAAEPGKCFLTLPIRYHAVRVAGPPADATSTAPSISRTSLIGKDARGFYGLKNAPSVDGCIRLDGLDSNPVYERLEFLSGEDNSGLVVMRNKLGPRRDAGENPPKPGKPRQAKLRDEPQTIRSTGAAAMVFEIPDNAERLNFEWSSGSPASIDLAYLRRAHETALDKIRPPSSGDAKKNGSWTSVPAVAESLTLLIGPSPSMAALAIERLSRIRNNLIAAADKNESDDDALAEWIADVDGAVVASAVRDEERIRVAVWRYFCTHPAKQKPMPLADELLDLFADAGSEVQARWIQLVACGLRIDDCGYWWRQTGGVEPPSTDSIAIDSNPALIHRAAVVSILGAILRSEDTVVATEAMDLLTNLQPPVADWSFLEEASVAAQWAALSHVGGLPDRASAARIVQTLILSARPETAVEIARAARSIGSSTDDTNDLLLSPWRTLHPKNRKPAFLAALCGIDLGASVYSPRFADIIKEAVAADAPTRDAAWKLLIAQLRLRKENAAAGNETGRPMGPFPLIIARSAQDPLTRGAAEIARQAKSSLRFDAISALVESGYGEQAAVCLMEACPASEDREAALNQLLPLAGTGHRDAVMAMLGALLNRRCESSAGRILDRLSRTIAGVDQEEQWRILAAVKAGANLVDLDELGPRLGPPTSNAVLRWLHALGHMSPQDRQRLAASRDPAERSQRLAQINFRRGQLVDGRYGVVAVISTTGRLNSLSGHNEAPNSLPRWSPPKQITLALEPLLLETSEEHDVFRVRCGDRTLGEGLALQQPQPIRGPAAYLPAVETAGPWGHSPIPNDTPPTPATEDEQEDRRRIGPLQLPGRVPLDRLSPGTMTLDISGYLTDALKTQRVFGDEDLSGLVPQSYKITLRYGAFGSFSGCGPKRSPWEADSPPPKPGTTAEPPPSGPRFLLNVMLIVERMD